MPLATSDDDDEEESDPPRSTPVNEKKSSITTVERNDSVSMTALDCLLCTETISRKKRTHRESCCEAAYCQPCMYRHITSVWEDAATGGQRPLKCPAGCGRPLTDLEVRSCLHEKHAVSIAWEIIGSIVYGILMRTCGLATSNYFSSTPSGSMKSCRHYRLWRYLLHARNERRDLDRYEQWSVNTGLKHIKEPDGETTAMIQHCPAPNCGYSWIATAFRREKQMHERQRFYLWYRPIAPETVPMDWVEPDFLHVGPDAPPAPFDWDSTKKDGRRMVCAQCHYVFCGLCRNPWFYTKHRHAGKSCQAFGRTLPAAGQDLMATTVGARVCPQCHTITSRTAGCNHITCPCGKEWCYICGADWSHAHYACVDRNDSVEGCIIL